MFRPSFSGVADWGGWAVTLGDQYSDGSGASVAVKKGETEGTRLNHVESMVYTMDNLWLIYGLYTYIYIYEYMWLVYDLDYIYG